MLGWTLYWLDKLKNRYGTRRNTRMVVNRGGVISGRCILSEPKHIEIGKGSYINGGDIRASEHARIIIGENCLLSYSVHLRTDMHNFMDKNTPIKEQGVTERDIVIGNDVWIGYGAQVMSGVRVADGCVIGAGAVVTHDTEPYGVYAGVPARLIRFRSEGEPVDRPHDGAVMQARPV